MPTKKEPTQRHSLGNRPHDKGGHIHLLEIPTEPPTLENEWLAASGIEEDPPFLPDWQFRNGHRRGERRFEAVEGAHVVVFDLETQLSADEVGGWNNVSLMRVSCGVAWDSREARFITYFEDQIDELIGLLRRADLVVGFNVIGFDYRVLRGYSRYDFRKLKTLDILREVHAYLNYRVSLDSLAAATFNAVKTGDGLQAPALVETGPSRPHRGVLPAGCPAHSRSIPPRPRQRVPALRQQERGPHARTSVLARPGE